MLREHKFLDSFLGAGLVFIICLAIMGIGLTPTWLFIFARSALSPEGFWQQFLFYGLGVYLLGGFQIILFVGSVVLTAGFLDMVVHKK